MSTDHHHDDDRLDRGLAFDLGHLMNRRRALVLLAGAGAGAALAACGGGGPDDATSATTEATTDSSTTTTAAQGGGPGAPPGGGGGGGMGGEDTASADDPDAIPNETAGPYPGDGSNGPDVLLESGVVRSDITTSFGDASGVAEGIPLTMTFTVTDSDTGEPLPGHAVYAWHCDREGRYSMYSEGVEDENYLRGVQEADADGKVTFTSIFPACYAGRWPHVHFEVYESLDVATSSGAITATSQMAFPQGRVRDGVRHRGLRAEREQPLPGVVGERRHLQRRLRHPDGVDLRLGGPGLHHDPDRPRHRRLTRRPPNR